MNIARLYCSLLVTMQEVSRAGEALGIGQSSASISLNLLRAEANDELFDCTGIGMQTTLRAHSIMPAVRLAIEALD